MFRSILVEGHIADGSKGWIIVDRIDGHAESDLERGIITTGVEVPIGAGIFHTDCDDGCAKLVRHGLISQCSRDIGTAVVNGGIGDESWGIAAGGDSQVLCFSTTCSDAFETDGLLRGIFIDGDIEHRGDGRQVVDGVDGDSERLGEGQVVGRAKCAIIARIVNGHGNHRGAVGVACGCKFQGAGGLWGGVGHIHCGDQTGVVAACGNAEILSLATTGRDSGEVDGLLTGIFIDGEICRVIQRWSVIDGSDCDCEGNG